MTLYIWTVPFNLYKIGKGFGVKSWQTLPFKEVTYIIFLSLLSSPFAIIYILISDHNWVVQLFVAFFLYFPIAGGILYKFRYLEIPVKYERYIPKFLKREFK